MEYIANKDLDKWFQENYGDDYDLEDYDEDSSGTYKASIRQMFFPSSFTGDAAEMIKKDSICEKCRATSDLTLDHKEPVAQYFNRIGYRQSKEVRANWYNDTSNLRIYCRSCNSGRPKVRFDPAKVKDCIYLEAQRKNN